MQHVKVSLFFLTALLFEGGLPPIDPTCPAVIRFLLLPPGTCLRTIPDGLRSIPMPAHLPLVLGEVTRSSPFGA